MIGKILRFLGSYLPTQEGELTVSQSDGKARIYRGAAVRVLEDQGNKGVAGGYPELNGSALVPTAQLGTGTASSSTFLRGDGTWAAGGGGGVTDHALLTSLDWASSGHTSTADRLAGFSGAGAAVAASITAPLAYGSSTLSLSGWSGTTDGDMLYRNGTAVGTKTPAQARTWLDLASLYQPLDAELSAIAGLTSAADKLPYFTGSGTAALADFSSFGRSLVDDANAAAARTTLGLAIGTDVQAYDADLTGLAGLGNGLPVRSAGTWTTATISAPLSLSGSTLSVDLSGYQPLDAELSALAGLSSTGLIARTGAGTVAARTVTGGSGITVTNGDGVSGNPEIAVQEDVKGFPLYRLFTVIQPQGVVAPNVDGVGASITSAGVYGVNVSEADFPCTQYGDASASGCRFYVLGYFRIEAGTVTTDILFKMGSDIAAGITVVHIGFSSNISVTSGDPTGHRYTIRWLRGTDTNWQLSVKDNVTQTLVDTGVAVTADYYYAVRFVATSSTVSVQISAGSTVTAAKNGIDAAGTTSTSSNLPGTANDLYAIFSMQRSAASTSRCLKFGYWRTIQVMG